MTDLIKFPRAIEAKWSSGTKSLATSGGIFLDGAWWGPWDGRLAVASLMDKTLRVLEFSPSGDLMSEIIVSELTDSYGRLRTPMMGPDGALYVSTSEGGGNDKILRVTPQAAPRFPDTTDTTWDTPENADIDTIVATVAAEDPNGDAITYSLGGTDASTFNIRDAAVGSVRANALLDYETKSSYQVDVIATDPNSLSSKVSLTITVTDEDDAGAITLSSQAPIVGIDLTASITDPDGGVSNTGWTWSRSLDQTTWDAISGATSATYRPVTADVGRYLRATATYTDSQGPGKNVQQKTDAPVAATASSSVAVSKSTLAVTEGAKGTYTVKLNAQPASDVVINVTATGSADVTVDTDAATSGNQNTLTFTPSTWGTAQTVTVAAAQDADAVNDTVTIAHAVDASRSADEYDDVTIAGVTVTVTDDETAGVTVSKSTLTVAEDAKGTYTVKLKTQPASDVVINVTATGSADVTVDTDAATSGDQNTLTFTPSTWSTAQTVTVTAADDDDAVNDPASIAHAVVAGRSADEYDDVTVAGVAVTVTDDDTAGVTVSESTLTVAEGATGTYTVKLKTQPTSDVVIEVMSFGSDDVTVDTDAATSGDQDTLTFTRDNWNTAQTVTVTAAADTDAVNDSALIFHELVASRSADEYDAVPTARVRMTVTDDDTAGVTVSESTLTVAEGATGTYTVKLNTQLLSDVVINVTSNTPT